MTYLKLNQSTNITETVPNALLTKLFNIGKADDNASTRTLTRGVDTTDPNRPITSVVGKIYVPLTYINYIEYVGTKYPNLTVTVGDTYISFEDPAMEQFLISTMGLGDGNGITLQNAASATSVSNVANSTVTKFNELRYFTSITSSKGGFTSSTSGNCLFINWTALEEIDISNFTSLGHNNGYAWGDGFRYCSSLKKVTASSKLTQIGYLSFGSCTSLTEITGLSGEINLYGPAFLYCSSLPSTCFNNVLFYLLGGSETFLNCSAITEITLSPTNTVITSKCFKGCNNLTTINCSGQSITTLDSECFRGCSALTNIPDFSNVTTIGAFILESCSTLSSINLPSATSIGEYAFSGCTNLSGCGFVENQLFSVGKAAFQNCSKLVFPNNINVSSTASNLAFKNCKQLKGVTIVNPTAIGIEAFNGCTLLTTVSTSGNEYLTSLGNLAFYDCGLLTTLPDLSHVTAIGGRCFYKVPASGTLDLSSLTTLDGDKYAIVASMPNITKVIIGNLTTDLIYSNWNSYESGRRFINNMQSLTTLDIGSLQTFPNSYQEFNYCMLIAACPLFTTLILRNSTVCPLKNDSYAVTPEDIGGVGVTLYVPDGLVTLYRTATGWSNIAGQIKSINDLPS